jgi:hypothetical protein
MDKKLRAVRAKTNTGSIKRRSSSSRSTAEEAAAPPASGASEHSGHLDGEDHLHLVCCCTL